VASRKIYPSAIDWSDLPSGRDPGIATDFSYQGVQLLGLVLYAIQHQAKHIFGFIDESMMILDEHRPLVTPFMQIRFKDPLDLGRP
jgi:hypothetical protein